MRAWVRQCDGPSKNSAPRRLFPPTDAPGWEASRTGRAANDIPPRAALSARRPFRRIGLGSPAILLCFCALAGLASPVVAGRISTWHDRSAADFEKASPEGVVVDSEGHVMLSRRLESLARLECGGVWDLARDAAGNVYAGTVDSGKVIRIGPDGSQATLWESDEAQVFSVALAPDGSVLAGTGPDGTVLRIAEGEAEIFYKCPAQYVWDLAVDGDGNVYAATGPDGQIFRIGPDGEGSLFFDARQKHVLCLARADDGTLYAGTDGGGLVYRISPDAKGFVLYQSGEDEVRSLLLAADGALYAGTASPTGASRRSTGSSGSGSSGKSSSSNSSSGGSSKRKPGENAVYRIGDDGTVREVFRQKTMVFALLEQGSKLLAATGPDGVVYQIDPATATHCQLARVDSEQALCLVEGKEGEAILGTANPAAVHTLLPGFSESGTLVSRVFDAEMISRWGALRWQAELPEGTVLSIATRSGNVAEPDETWGGWSAEVTDPVAGAIASPTARFLQYRATLKSESAERTPTLRGVTLRFQTANQSPQITKIDVPHVDQSDGKKKQESLKITWSAKDPNKDELRYDLFFRKDGWKTWVPLADDLSKAEHEWNTTAVPEGTFRLRVKASDCQDNPPGEALSHELLSEPFVIDHSPPAISITIEEQPAKKATVAVGARDTITRVASARYSLDSQKWQNLFPEDKLFDSGAESFRFEIGDLEPGVHVLVVQSVDAAGNTGSADAVFEVQ